MDPSQSLLNGTITTDGSIVVGHVGRLCQRAGDAGLSLLASKYDQSREVSLNQLHSFRPYNPFFFAAVALF